MIKNILSKEEVMSENWEFYNPDDHNGICVEEYFGLWERDYDDIDEEFEKEEIRRYEMYVSKYFPNDPNYFNELDYEMKMYFLKINTEKEEFYDPDYDQTFL